MVIKSLFLMKFWKKSENPSPNTPFTPPPGCLVLAPPTLHLAQLAQASRQTTVGELDYTIIFKHQCIGLREHLQENPKKIMAKSMVSGEDFPNKPIHCQIRVGEYFPGIIDDHLRGDRENCSYVGTIDSCFADHENDGFWE